MLLTRSPLSPGPKSWFSLDLHVLSAPPAFVLSQDQTLREELVAGDRLLRARADKRVSSQDELELKVSSPFHHVVWWDDDSTGNRLDRVSGRTV